MEKLLQHYQRELVRLREATRRYAEQHPATADALELGPDASTDPEVERLLQSVALLNAATQKMIEEGRSEFHKALLQTLQPHYLRAVPACGIVQVDTSSVRENEIISVRRLPREATLRSGAHKFTTVYDACISPISIGEVAFKSTIDLPATLRLPGDATSVLIVELMANANSASFHEPAICKLRIHVEGDPGLRSALMDAILMHAKCVCIEADGKWQVLANPPFSAVGMTDNEALLPRQPGPQSPRLLTEFFHLPQKFDFIDLDLEAISIACAPGCKRIALHIVLPICNARLRAASAGNILLACTPVVNLFPIPAIPILLNGRSEAYPLLPKEAGCEIYSVEKVSMKKARGDCVLPPFHGKEHSIPGPYWQLDEREGTALRLIDREQRPVRIESGTIAVLLTCTNSDPLHGTTKLITEAKTLGFPIRLLDAITASGFAPDYGQLSESLCTGEITLSVLRNQLELHGCKYARALKGLISKPCTAWLEHPMGRVHMHGTEFILLVDETALQEHSTYVFTEILAATLADKLRENRFAQLKVANENGQQIHSARPRAGTLPLL